MRINMYGKVFGKFTLIKSVDNAESLFTAIMKISHFARAKGLNEVAKFSSNANIMADTYLFSNGNESIMFKIEEEA